MPTEEEQKRQETFLLLLLALAHESEGRSLAGVRPRLVESMRRIRRIIQQLPPTGQFRIFEWSRLTPSLLAELETISDALRVYLPPQLQTLSPDVQDRAYDFARPKAVEDIELRPRTQQQIMLTTKAGAVTLAALIGTQKGGRTRLAIQMQKDLDAMVRSAIFQDKPTQQIADDVIKLLQNRGQVVASIKTGSFANRMWNRVRNTVVAATWDAVTSNLLETWQDLDVDTWIWNAVLDPRTCPICSPLDGQTRPAPTGFPYIPPVHPRCRCAVLPVLG